LCCHEHRRFNLFGSGFAGLGIRGTDTYLILQSWGPGKKGQIPISHAGIAGLKILIYDEIGSADWIQRQAVMNMQLVHALQQDLDGGEAEAIALSLEIGADLLLMDENLGRETARHLGLRYIGLIGALVMAKRKGLINAVKPHLDGILDHSC
jgi:predicted nucleic acid-binding protein